MCDFCRSALTFRPRDLALFNSLLLLERCSAVRYGEDNTKSTFPEQNVGFHPSISRHGITRASSVLLIWLNENVGFHPSISRHSITRASSVLLIWLNENVGFHPSFSRHGITRASSVLLIWLNENVHKRATTSPLFREKYVPLQ